MEFAKQGRLKLIRRICRDAEDGLLRSCGPSLTIDDKPYNFEAADLERLRMVECECSCCKKDQRCNEIFGACVSGERTTPILQAGLHCLMSSTRKLSRLVVYRLK